MTLLRDCVKPWIRVRLPADGGSSGSFDPLSASMVLLITGFSVRMHWLMDREGLRVERA